MRKTKAILFATLVIILVLSGTNMSIVALDIDEYLSKDPHEGIPEPKPEPFLVTHPWPMVRCNPQRTGQSICKGPQTATLKWIFDVGCEGYFAPDWIPEPILGSDRKIYLAMSNEALYNPDAERFIAIQDYGNYAEEIWNKTYDAPKGSDSVISISLSALVGKFVYYTITSTAAIQPECDDEFLSSMEALDSKDGKYLWYYRWPTYQDVGRKWSQKIFPSTRGLVYSGRYSNKLITYSIPSAWGPHRLDPRSEEYVPGWRISTFPPLFTPPVDPAPEDYENQHFTDREVVIATDIDGTIYWATINKTIPALIVQSLDGTTSNAVHGISGDVGPIAIHDNTLYITTSSFPTDKLFAFNLPSLELKWGPIDSITVQGEKYYFHGDYGLSIAKDGTIYMPADDGRQYNPKEYLLTLHDTGEGLSSLWIYQLDSSEHFTSNIYSAFDNGFAIGGNGIVYFVTTKELGRNGCIHAVNKNGEQQWYYIDDSVLNFGSISIGIDGTLYTLGISSDNLGYKLYAFKEN